MTKEDISKYAYMGEMPETKMSCPERCLWYALRDVYRRFQSGDLTKEQSIAEKTKSIRQFELDCKILHLADRIVSRDASMWAEIELAGSMYRLDRTLENADAFIHAVYNVKMKNPGSPKEGDSV